MNVTNVFAYIIILISFQRNCNFVCKSFAIQVLAEMTDLNKYVIYMYLP